MYIKIFSLILVILLVILALFWKGSNSTLTLVEATSLLESCKINSVGKSHEDITNKVFTVRNKDGNLFKIDETNKDQFYEKLNEVIRAKKCPNIVQWRE
jgi:uncharacterized protein (UPF0333 family)